MTIKAWGAGKWYCEKCDVRENEYGRVMVSWTASWPPPKFCWKCFAKKWESPASVINAVWAIVEALKKHGGEVKNAADIRFKLDLFGVKVNGVSSGRLAAMVYREW